ncbi:hypothetical protein BPLS_P6396 [Bathymodiolus platifrons methanotrophic gill symbiont]|uniref:restriction endonuclease subunit S n=1 Tax=Bathymodiolus platifrons methanotrophic gill symbiont TaxID=113268 RepID=UPI001B462630|nr:restriction endonuclease subunit S [Bathymodiolus platifrons methanotrophic gill symbiont]GFO77762.1 hypothetical protein BPLS_P6396 [Bathymodiolus platifrons methanotrophic gill symbiont]
MGELFEFEAIKQAKSQKAIPTDNTENGVPYIVQSMSNNMFSRNVNKQWLIEHNEFPVSGNRIVLGVTLPAVSYQPVEFGASQVITAKSEWLNNKNGVFISSSISKLMYQFSYQKKPGMKIYKNMSVLLPAKNGGADFEFMENFIAELEAERIAELEAYLSAAGLKDTTLTIQEQQALEDFENGGWSWGEFSYQSIFNNISQGRRLKKDDQITGDMPFVMAGTTNTGVVNYISNPVASFPKNSITIDIFGNTFYRNYSFGAGDDTGVYWSNQKNYSKETMLFFTTSIEKSLFGKFSYGKKLRSSQSFDFKMNLPEQEKQPCMYSMEKLISAVKKLVIKDVVHYSDKKIASTKQVVQS